MADVLDLSRPRRIHIVGVGGAGMSAIASVLAAMGHAVSGSDLKDSGRLRRLAGERHRRARRSRRRARRRRRTRRGVDRHPAAQPRGRRPRTSAASPVAAPGRDPRRHRVDPAHASPCRARTARPRPRRCSRSCSSRPACDPSFIIGGELNEIGSGAVWDDGEWFVVEADESDGTFVALPAEHVVVTNVEADHLDYYGDARRDRGGVRPVPRPRRAPRSCAPTIRSPPSSAAAHGRGRCTGRATTPRCRIVDARTERAGAAFGIVRDGDALGEIRLPVPGLHNARNATAALAMAMELGVPFDACRARAGRGTRAWPAASSSAVERRRRHVRRRLRAQPRQGQGGPRSGCRRRVAPGRLRVPAPPLHAHGRALARLRRRRSIHADVVVVMDVYGAGERPQPGVTGQADRRRRPRAPAVEAGGLAAATAGRR